MSIKIIVKINLPRFCQCATMIWGQFNLAPHQENVGITSSSLLCIDQCCIELFWSLWLHLHPVQIERCIVTVIYAAMHNNLDSRVRYFQKETIEC